MYKIKQGRLSPSVSSFDFLGTYGLNKYSDPGKPCIFFGCYGHIPSPIDYKALKNHRGLAVVVWCGSDALLMPKHFMNRIKTMRNVKHVAIGSFIAKDLAKHSIPFVKLPLSPTLPEPNPQPLGDSIYVYLPDANIHQRRFYGGDYIDQLRKLFPNTPWIITRPRQHSKEKMQELYKKSFIGLRLTQHDGLSNTVLELGAMGRMCVYNDSIPNAIPWVRIEDIAKSIRKERALIGQTKVDVANAVGNFLDIPDDWLYTNFWQ